MTFIIVCVFCDEHTHNTHIMKMNTRRQKITFIPKVQEKTNGESQKIKVKMNILAEKNQ